VYTIGADGTGHAQRLLRHPKGLQVARLEPARPSLVARHKKNPAKAPRGFSCMAMEVNGG